MSLLSTGLFSNVVTTLVNNGNFSLTNFSEGKVSTIASSATNAQVSFESNDVSTTEDNLYTQLDSSSNFRNNAFTNPIISYDFKCGHYLGI